MKKLFLFLCLFWAGVACATQHTVANKDTNNVFTGTDQFLLGITSGPVTFSQLTTVPSQTDGTIIYCSDCVVQDPCAGVGTGAFAERVSGAWACATHGASGGSGSVNSGTTNTLGKYVTATTIGNSSISDNGTAITTAETFSASQLISTVSTGTAPLSVTSTTVVPNLNVSQLLGNTWAAPGTIGGTTPGNATFNNLTINGTCTGCTAGTVTHTLGDLTAGNFILGNGTADIKDSTFSIVPIANGGTGTATPGLVAGTAITITGSWPNNTINASTNALTLLGSTWTSPPAIGGGTPNTGTFTNLVVTGTCTGCSGGTWGSITGTLSNQTDLQTALNGKLSTGLAVLLTPAASQTTQSASSSGISLIAKCPASAGSTLACLQAVDNTGANIFQAEQNGTTQFGTGVGGNITLTAIVGPNSNPATTGQVRVSTTDSAICWRSNDNTQNFCLSKGSTDVASLAIPFAVVGGYLDLTEVAAPSGNAGHDFLVADSTAHALKASLNGGSFTAIPLIAGDLGGTSAAPIVSKIDGTSVPINSAADQVLETTASATGAWATVPDCHDSSHGLAYTQSTHAWSCQSITGTAGGLSDPGGNGVVIRTALNTTTNRTLTGTASQITVTNGDGTGGNPTFALDTTHVATDTNSLTFTNKTADAEGTGNVYTRPFYVEFTPECSNASSSPGSFDVPTASAATFTCAGTTTTHAFADFVDGSTTTITGHFTLPQGWTGNMDVRGAWFANASSSNAVRWSVQTGCVADSESVNAGPTSYNTASASNTSYTGTANQRKTTTLSAISMTNCSAGEEMYFQWSRIGADAGDTLTATAELLSIQFEGRATK